MSGDDSKLPTRLFGYRKAVVEQILQDRDTMVRAAEERVRSAESRVEHLEGTLQSMRTDNSRLEAQLSRFGEQLDSLSARVEDSIEASIAEATPSEGPEEHIPQAQAAPADSTASQLMAEELTSILLAGQEAAARMIERARDEAQRQILEANRLLGEVHAGVRQFRSWREDVQPVIVRVQGLVDMVRNHLAQTPERVQHALAPLAEAMLTIDGELLELSSVCRTPFPDSTEGLVAGGQAEPTEVPDTASAGDPTGNESIWLTVREDEVTVAEGSENDLSVEASAG